MRVLFYGRLADTFGSQVEVDAPDGCTVAQLRERLIAELPGAEPGLRNERTRALVAGTLVFDDHRLRSAETIEFLPPVSGG